MKLHFLTPVNRSPRLILLFAGWGMSPHPLETTEMPGYDVAVVWDYRDMSAPWLEEITSYEEIAVVAWSFGVHAAGRFMAGHPQLHITARIAVNGTRFTADDTRGIPRAIFDATLAGLSGRSITKFNMRMCGGSAAYKEFALRAPQRDVDELREELKAFDTSESPYMLWDKAVISTGDLIIPPGNQQRAWATDAAQTITIDGPHLPDFNMILRSCLTDKTHVEKRFRKAETTYDDNASAQLASATRLLDLTSAQISEPTVNLLEIGCGTGRFSDMALTRFRPARATMWDLHISPRIEALRTRHGSVDISVKNCDAETEITRVADETYDLILSASAVQWFNSLRAFLERASRALKPGGTLALSTYGPDTMREIHQALGTSSRFPSLNQIRRMLPPALVALELHEERHTTHFGSPLEVLRHMSRTGVNGLTSSGTSNASAAARLLKSYPLNREGKAPLTYHPIYIILRKP